MTATDVATGLRDPSEHSGQRRPSTPLDLVLVVLVLAFGSLGLRPLGDPDVWWHLRTGELLIRSGFTTTDPWTTASSKPWVLHEWASEVLMYLAYEVGGYRGVVLLHAIGMLVLAALLVRSIRRVSNTGPAIFISFLALAGVLLGSGERPQLVSWILLAAVLPALRRGIAGRRAPWWLIPVVWAWANIHGLWASVLVLYAFLVLGMIIDVGVRDWRSYRAFVQVGVLSGFAAALTPNGPTLLLTPLQVRAYAKFVSEWTPPSLLNPFFGAAFALIGIVLIAWGRSGRKIPAAEISFVVGTLLVGLPYVRTIPVVAIAIAPVAANAIQQMLGQPPPAFHLDRTNRALFALLLGAYLASVAVWLPQVPTVKRGAPWEASRVLDALPGRARVLNEYELGGWLLWTARDTVPSIDGRTEIYAPSYVARAMSAPRMGRGWQAFVRQGHFDAAWLYKDEPLVFALKAEGWRQVYRDETSVILLPTARR